MAANIPQMGLKELNIDRNTVPRQLQVFPPYFTLPRPWDRWHYYPFVQRREMRLGEAKQRAQYHSAGRLLPLNIYEQHSTACQHPQLEPLRVWERSQGMQGQAPPTLWYNERNVSTLHDKRMLNISRKERGLKIGIMGTEGKKPNWLLFGIVSL